MMTSWARYLSSSEVCLERVGNLLISLALLGCHVPPSPVISSHPNHMRSFYNEPMWWTVVPLHVHFDQETMSEQEILVVRHGFEVWNRHLGEEIFVFPNLTQEQMVATLQDKDPGHVFVFIGQLEREISFSARRNRILGKCNWMTNRDRWGVEISFQQAHVGLIPKQRWDHLMFVAMHEAGHVLGLVHDTDTNSIMHRHPLQSGLVIMDEDAEYVKEQFNRVRRERSLFQMDAVVIP